MIIGFKSSNLSQELFCPKKRMLRTPRLASHKILYSVFIRMYKCLLKTRVYTKIVFNLYNLQLYQYNINTEIAQPSANRSACGALPTPQIDNRAQAENLHLFVKH